MLVTRTLQHGGNRRDRCRRAYPISASGQPNAQTAMIREPLQRIPDGPSVHRAGSDAAHAIPEVKAVYGFRIARTDPAQSYHERTNAQHKARPDSVNQVSLKRYQPGFKG